MKILLIGKLGQIGSEIYKIAEARKYAIRSFSKEELDITDHKKVHNTIAAYKPDVIINASGYHLVPDCEKYPEQAFALNVYAVKNLAEISEQVGARFVNFSTDKVFDGTKNTLYTESDVTNPLQIYGISKLAGEIVTHEFAKHAYTLRTCGVFGGVAGSRIKKGNFVLYIIHEAKTKKSLDVSSDQIASFINAETLAHATLSILEKNAPPGIYHIVHDGYDSWVNFAREIIRLSNLSLTIQPIDKPKIISELHIPSFQAMSNQKAKQLGILLDTWQNGLAKYIAYLKNQGII